MPSPQGSIFQAHSSEHLIPSPHKAAVPHGAAEGGSDKKVPCGECGSATPAQAHRGDPVLQCQCLEVLPRVGIRRQSSGRDDGGEQFHAGMSAGSEVMAQVTLPAKDSGGE